MPEQTSQHRPLLEALRQARSTVVQTASSPEDQRLVGAILKEIDRALASLEPTSMLFMPLTAPEGTAPLPEEDEREVLQREVERLRVLVEQERGLLEAVLEQSPHGILISDAQGRLILQSRAAERIWAGSARAEDVEGWGTYRAFHPDGRPYEADDWSMARCLRYGETTYAEEVHFQRFDGTHGVLLGSCAPLTADDGRLLGAVSVFADITRFKQVEQLKDRWVAVAGHEMRAPLSVMKLRIALGKRNLERQRPQDLASILNLLDEQVDRLNAMVNDMLDVSRAQAGTLLVDLETVPLKPLVERVVESLGQTSSVHTFESVLEDVTVRCDRLRTEQVITNLVGNAIRYSDGGRITIRLTQQGDEARLEVTDEGRGIDSAMLPHLFEPFVRVTHDTNREGGLGLGLYLSRELVSRMGGRIWAQSPGRGQGSTFGFTLPLAPASISDATSPDRDPTGTESEQDQA